jgi:EVE domain
MMNAHWIAVASAQHVRLGRAQGFMQVAHGKLAPLKRIKPGDGVVYYAPTTIMGVNDKLQSFIAIGQVKPGEPYAHDMGGGFVPYRRDVNWFEAQESPIRPLLQRLSFSKDQAHWGYQLRFGLFKISPDDWALIAQAMQATAFLTPAGLAPSQTDSQYPPSASLTVEADTTPKQGVLL